MNYSGPAIALSIWVTLVGFRIAYFALSERRRRRSHHSANKEKEIDKISQLPDDILISIIARRPTKEAARTSILSKRWRNLYNFVPDINFHCDYVDGPFVSCPNDPDVYGVDRFLRRRSGLKIRSLHLSCCLVNLHSDRYDKFCYSLGRLGIERLVLSGFCGGKKRRTDHSFSCHLISHMPSLKYLELCHCSFRKTPSLVRCDMGLCSLLHMPSLKLSQSNTLDKLRLSSVTISDGALECVLSNCLSLQTLSIDVCKFPSKVCIRGPNLQLKHICIGCSRGMEEIEFYADNLTTFEYTNEGVVANFIFDHVPKLQSIFVDFWNKNTMSCICTKLIKDTLPHLKSLFFATKGDIYKVSPITMGIYTFSNLRQLSIHLYVTTEVKLLLLAPFLQRCPHLQEFHLNTEFVEYYTGRELRWPDAEIHLGLKKIEITGYSGTKPEIEFALHMLKSTISLEQMQLCTCSKWYEGAGYWVGRGKNPLSKETHETINKRLQSQALSNKARVIIQHKPIYK